MTDSGTKPQEARRASDGGRRMRHSRPAQAAPEDAGTARRVTRPEMDAPPHQREPTQLMVEDTAETLDGELASRWRWESPAADRGGGAKSEGVPPRKAPPQFKTRNREIQPGASRPGRSDHDR